MATVSTKTERKINQNGDVITIKTITTQTTTKPGQKPDVKVTETVEKYEGKDSFKNLPEELRKQLEDTTPEKSTVKPTDKTATKGKFVEECLKEHNKYRKMHGAPDLKLSKKMVKYCEERAKLLAEKDKMVPQEQNGYGENVFGMWSNDGSFAISAAEVVARWYKESEKYDFANEPKDLEASHFTQMVWKKSKEFGVAAAKSDTNNIYVVAAYEPSGNYVSRFKDNVSPSGTAIAKKAGSDSDSNSASDNEKDSSDDNNSDPQTKLNKESVRVHNEYRKRHGVPPLTHSKELQRYAQEWADNLARTDGFQHRTNNKYGENLYCSYSSDPRAVATPADAVKSWYDEIKYYTFGNASFSSQTGHFTQVVWKDSKEVGMGMAKSRSGRQIIVANYNPPGNFMGKFGQNVPRPIH